MVIYWLFFSFYDVEIFVYSVFIMLVYFILKIYKMLVYGNDKCNFEIFVCSLFMNVFCFLGVIYIEKKLLMFFNILIC